MSVCVCVCVCVCVELCEGRRVDTEGFTFRILQFWQKQKNQKTQRDKKYIYIVPPDAQQVGVSEAISLLSLLLNSETTLINFPEPEPSWLARERPGRFTALNRLRAQPPSPRLLASPPTGRPPRLPWVFLCSPPGSRSRRRCLSKDPGPGGRWGEVCVSLREPQFCTLPASARIPVYLQADLDSISCPPFPSGLPRRKMVPQAGGSGGNDLLFCFFFFFS